MADLEDEGISDLLNVQYIIDKTRMATDPSECEVLNKTDKQENIQEEVKVLRLSLQEKGNALYGLMNTSMNPPASSSTPATNMAPVPSNGYMWHKDLKISGQIDEPGQKNLG